MDGASGTNYADFGEFTLSSIKGSVEDNIAWLNMPAEDKFWFSSAVQAVQIGDNEYTSSGLTAAYALAEFDITFSKIYYDTGISLIYAPHKSGY